MKTSSLFHLGWTIFLVHVCQVAWAMPGREYVAGTRLAGPFARPRPVLGSSAAITRPLMRMPFPAGRLELAGKLHRVTGVPFNAQGHPIFQSKFSFQLRPADLRAPNYVQFKRANEALRKALLENPQLRQKFSPTTVKEILDATGSKAPSGYVWHHSHETGKLELVDFDIHQKTHHAPGGKSIWGKPPSPLYYRRVMTRWTCLALLDLGVSAHVSYRRGELDETAALRIGSGVGASWVVAVSTESILARYWPAVAGGPATWPAVAYLATRLVIDACWNAYLREQLARQEAACRTAECLARWQTLQQSVAASNAYIDVLLRDIPPRSLAPPRVNQGSEQ